MHIRCGGTGVEAASSHGPHVPPSKLRMVALAAAAWGSNWPTPCVVACCTRGTTPIVAATPVAEAEAAWVKKADVEAIGVWGGRLLWAEVAGGAKLVDGWGVSTVEVGAPAEFEESCPEPNAQWWLVSSYAAVCSWSLASAKQRGDNKHLEERSENCEAISWSLWQLCWNNNSWQRTCTSTERLT